MPESVPRPLCYKSFAHCGMCECEWTANGKHSIHLWEPIDSDAPEDAHPSWNYSAITFYDRSGNKLLIRQVNVHDLTRIGDTYVCIGNHENAHWWHVVSGSLIWRPEYTPRAWFVRWLCYDNDDRSRMLNAGWSIFQQRFNPARNFPDRDTFTRMIDLRRKALNISWREVSRQIGGVPSSTLTRFNSGKAVDAKVIFALAEWYNHYE